MTCPKGAQLRPHIVWFGEAAPMIEPAAELCAGADYFIVMEASLVVYPAAGLVNYVPQKSPKYVVDPKEVYAPVHNVTCVKEPASSGLKKVVDELLHIAAQK